MWCGWASLCHNAYNTKSDLREVFSHFLVLNIFFDYSIPKDYVLFLSLCLLKNICIHDSTIISAYHIKD